MGRCKRVVHKQRVTFLYGNFNLEYSSVSIMKSVSLATSLGSGSILESTLFRGRLSIV
jgi:hypothetical protein